jgi:hypothetical protein
VAARARLRAKTEGDTLDRLLRAIEKEKRRLRGEDVDVVHIDSKPSENESK